MQKYRIKRIDYDYNNSPNLHRQIELGDSLTSTVFYVQKKRFGIWMTMKLKEYPDGSNAPFTTYESANTTLKNYIAHGCDKVKSVCYLDPTP
jgi:hypothetical protein